MDLYHREILEEIKKQGKGVGHTAQPEGYTGSAHFGYGLRVPVHRQIIKDWIKRHPDLTTEELINLLNSLFEGKSMDEKQTGGKLLEYLPKLRKNLSPKLLDRWLDDLTGWAEIDSLCQGSFSSKDLLSNFPEWRSLIENLSKDNNMSKRRASLVLLVKPVGESADPRLSELAFVVIERLQNEKDILITKAISWLLRTLISNHRNNVENYLMQNKNYLPKIAVRETTRKLLTGKK